MAPAFVFEPPSDEELDHVQAEEEDDEVEEANEEEDEEEAEKRPSDHKSQSPWDFGSYSETVAEEHARRSTTSIDFKISKVLQNRYVPITNDGSDSAESEPDKQVTIRLPLLLNPSIQN